MSVERQPSPEPPPVSPITINSDDETPPSAEQRATHGTDMSGTTVIIPGRRGNQQGHAVPLMMTDQAHYHLNNALQTADRPGYQQGYVEPLMAANQQAQFYYQTIAQMQIPLMEEGVDDEINDTVMWSLGYMHAIRTLDDDLGIDENFLKFVRKPVPTVKNRLAIPANSDIPNEIYNYFKIMTYHTNKIFAVVYLWLDLYCNNIYVPFRMVCDIQVRLIRDGIDILHWVAGAPLHAQTIDAQRVMLGNWASARLLHNWSKTERGRSQIERMEMIVDKERTSDENTADMMLYQLEVYQWLHYLGGPKGHWMHQVNQRMQ